MYSILFLTLFSFLTCAESKWAAVVTIAGNNKLSEYFEWTCKSFTHVSDIADLLVFHENNVKVLALQGANMCANNVRFVSVGQHGFARIISKVILNKSALKNKSVKNNLKSMLSFTINHMPRYLVEVKPMTGSLFEKYLIPYSHWTYTDADIVWGNITAWINVTDINSYDVVTLGKLNDAGKYCWQLFYYDCHRLF